ncbi:unnamed protein product [Lymnaea stagnalis]|uniref:Chitin-binding type-2 domain-containing protein n=1 Tax=Lymnaea stagnalis TaxID=6523 RepID=A0AAV2H0J1_LYMST
MHHIRSIFLVAVLVSVVSGQRSLYQGGNDETRKVPLQQPQQHRPAPKPHTFPDPPTQKPQRPQQNFLEDNYGAEAGCKDPWTTEWTRDPNDCTQVHFCIQGKKQWTINCNDTRIWSNVGHACVEPMSQWDDCNQVMTTPTLIKVVCECVHTSNKSEGPTAMKSCPKSLRDGLTKSRVKHGPCIYLYRHCLTFYPDDPRCLNDPSGMNPDPDNCAQFLACVNMTVVATMECPTNTLFSTRNNTCELSFMVASECRERSIPGHVIITTASPIVDKPCEGTSNGDVGDPTHCARFYKCNYGRVVARIRCPSNSAFNEEKKKCDWRANVDCGARPIF